MLTLTPEDVQHVLLNIKESLQKLGVPVVRIDARYVLTMLEEVVQFELHTDPRVYPLQGQFSANYGSPFHPNFGWQDRIIKDAQQVYLESVDRCSL